MSVTVNFLGSNQICTENLIFVCIFLKHILCIHSFFAVTAFYLFLSGSISVFMDTCAVYGKFVLVFMWTNIRQSRKDDVHLYDVSIRKIKKVLNIHRLMGKNVTYGPFLDFSYFFVTDTPVKQNNLENFVLPTFRGIHWTPCKTQPDILWQIFFGPSTLKKDFFFKNI